MFVFTGTIPCVKDRPHCTTILIYCQSLPSPQFVNSFLPFTQNTSIYLSSVVPHHHVLCFQSSFEMEAHFSSASLVLSTWRWHFVGSPVFHYCPTPFPVGLSSFWYSSSCKMLLLCSVKMYIYSFLLHIKLPSCSPFHYTFLGMGVGCAWTFKEGALWLQHCVEMDSELLFVSATHYNF